MKIISILITILIFGHGALQAQTYGCNKKDAGSTCSGYNCPGGGICMQTGECLCPCDVNNQCVNSCPVGAGTGTCTETPMGKVCRCS